jgi:hypothetical protein
MSEKSFPFVAFPKISRLSREVIITEKLDGTNAQIYIADPEPEIDPHAVFAMYDEVGMFHNIYAGSRTRWLTPTGKDNYGFASWVKENGKELFKLGPGHHFGEWWGQGIQRGYGLKEKRFSLFNISKWSDPEVRPKCCSVVPRIYPGSYIFDKMSYDIVIEYLRTHGSFAAPGFMKPEGIVIFHSKSGHLYKKTIENDDSPKGVKNAE